MRLAGCCSITCPRREPRRYLYDLVGDYPRRGGRAFRPSLCIATARAFGSPMEVALRTAASIEMMHNAMLIHDDIEDESEQRRGKPAMHVSEGVPIAINVGDMLSLLAMRPLLDNRRLLGSGAGAADSRRDRAYGARVGRGPGARTRVGGATM